MAIIAPPSGLYRCVIILITNIQRKTNKGKCDLNKIVTIMIRCTELFLICLTNILIYSWILVQFSPFSVLKTPQKEKIINYCSLQVHNYKIDYKK